MLHICDPLTAQPISLRAELFTHLNSLELADSPRDDTHLEVDILVGSYHYWELTTGKTVHGSESLSAIHTKLGWVLSGPAPLHPTMRLLQPSKRLITAHTLRIDAMPCSTDELNNTLR